MPGFMNYVMFLSVVAWGTGYPLVMQWSKHGENKYPFMIGVCIAVKNLLTLAYYSLCWTHKHFRTLPTISLRKLKSVAGRRPSEVVSLVVQHTTESLPSNDFKSLPKKVTTLCISVCAVCAVCVFSRLRKSRQT